MENKKFTLTGNYDYKSKIATWREFATVNKVITNCEKCHKTHAHKSVLLANGENVCWYCWIRKNADYDSAVVRKPVTAGPAKAKVATKAPKIKNTSIKNKPVKTSAAKKDVLEESLGTVDSRMNDTGDINEITKIANGALFSENVHKEKAAKKVKTAPKAKTASKPKTVKTVKTADKVKATNKVTKTTTAAKPVKVSEKTVKVEEKTSKNTDKVVKPAKDHKNFKDFFKFKKADNKKSIKTDNKKVIKTEKKVVTPVSSETIVRQGAKFNPTIKFFKDTKANKIVWNIVKFQAVILLALFAILGLYFASMWQITSARYGAANYDIGVLQHLRLIALSFDGVTNVVSYSWNFLADIAKIVGYDATAVADLNALLANANGIQNLSLMQLSGGFNEAMLTTLISFSIIGIVACIPTLVFKNRTWWSLGCISFSVICLIIVVVFFSLGIVAQNEYVTPIQSVRNSINEYLAIVNSKVPNPDRIAILKDLINNGMNNILALFA